MNHFQKLVTGLTFRLFLVALILNATLIGAWWALSVELELPDAVAFGALGAIGLLLAWLFASYAAALATKPVKAIWQTVVHLAPGERSTEAPKLDQLKVGRE